MLKSYLPRSRPWTARIAVVLCGWLALATGARAASSPEWIKVTAPEFTVITTLPEKRATAWAADFTQFVAAMRIYFPGERRLPRLTFVVFERERDFRGYRPTDAKGKPQEVAGFFLRQDSWAVAGMSGATISEDVRRVIFHEGAHWFLSSVVKPRPIWFEEGMAEVFSTFRIDKGRAEWGRAIPEHVDFITNEGAVPLASLLFTPRETLFAKGADHTGRIYAQSWAFVHFLLFGDSGIPRAKLQEYLDKRGSTKETDTAFREVFGRTYAEMDIMLKDYTSGRGVFHTAVSKIATTAAPIVGPASPIEVSDALARLAFAGGHEEQATMYANQTIATAPTDPRGYEIMGTILDVTGKSREAQEMFADAEKYGSKDFKVYYELAEFEQVNIGRLDSSGVNVRSASDTRRMADRYRKVIELSPSYRPAYSNLAALMPGLDSLNDEVRVALTTGARLFPDDETIAVGHAIVARKDGDLTTARARLDAVLAAGVGSTRPGVVWARQIDAAWKSELSPNTRANAPRTQDASDRQ